MQKPSPFIRPLIDLELEKGAVSLNKDPQAASAIKKVAIIQREIPHYRVRFFEELYIQGRASNLDIHVYTGAPQTSLWSGFPFHVLSLRYFGNKKTASYWMSGLKEEIEGSDIVVAPQELQCLTVPYLWMKRKHICKAWIWWGHGYNFQASVRPSISTNVKEAFKRFMTRRGDGIITYTAKGAEFWRAQGIPIDKVQPYYNTIDVDGLKLAGANIRAEDLQGIRASLMLRGKQVLLFSGRLYAEKKVDFLLRSFAILKKTYPDVALLIIGDGLERQRLEALQTYLRLTDVHFLGEVVAEKDTAPFFSLADLLVLPSLVGLAIVHGFAFGLPLVTTNAPGHGPEIEYLTQENGVVTPLDEQAYAEALQSLLSSPANLQRMKAKALEQSLSLSLSKSANHFLTLLRSVRSTAAL
jgi:glycosyltransferase involved in cell wall biosynthesis